MNQLRNYFLCAVTCLFLFTQAIQAQDAAQAKKTKETASRTVEDGGTGAFKAVMVSDSSLAQFTIFRPSDMSLITDKTKLPIIAWGNGGCENSPRGHLNFLSEVASHGYLVIAIGPIPGESSGQRGGAGMMGGGMPGGMMGGRGTRGAGAPAAATSDPNAKSQLTQAIDWAIAQDSNEASIYYKKLDTKKIAVAGMSCGGIQAYQAAPDARVSTVMICNSGLFSSGGGGMGGMPNLPKSHLEKVHGSIIFILGGESDMAYPNGMDDFAKLEKIPAFASNLGVGHGGTYMQPHGGDFAKVATAWLQWQLKADADAAKMFEGEPCGVAKMEGWSIQKKNIK